MTTALFSSVTAIPCSTATPVQGCRQAQESNSGALEETHETLACRRARAVEHRRVGAAAGAGDPLRLPRPSSSCRPISISASPRASRSIRRAISSSSRAAIRRWARPMARRRRSFSNSRPTANTFARSARISMPGPSRMRCASTRMTISGPSTRARTWSSSSIPTAA